jgi:tungstate transport system substrate-binding protein
MRQFLLSLRLVAVAAVLATAGCSQPAKPTVTLATTTSTQDSGLLDDLLPLFTEQTGIEVKVVAVGTGQALRLGRQGDADVLLVHDPDAEKRFMDDGFGSLRQQVMHNDFVVVGPPDDPAGIKGQTDVAAALDRIARKEVRFVSRGDESGTHQKERAIWRKAKRQPRGGWYLEAGAGMGQVLRMADQKRAYTLSDRATYLAQRKGLDLKVLCEGDPLLVNRYSVITVSADKHPHVRRAEAQRFADFLESPEARRVIRDFGKDRFGQPLFFVEDPER